MKKHRRELRLDAHLPLHLGRESLRLIVESRCRVEFLKLLAEDAVLFKHDVVLSSSSSSNFNGQGGNSLQSSLLGL